MSDATKRAEEALAESDHDGLREDRLELALRALLAERAQGETPGYRPCGCRDEGPPCRPGYHHQGHDICDECGICKECDLPIPDAIRQEYLALARFANGLYWALAQGVEGRTAARLELPERLALTFDGVMRFLAARPAQPDAVREAAERPFTREDAMTLIGHAEFLRRVHGEEDMPRYFDGLAKRLLAALDGEVKRA